ncbi:MAG: accessory Sec system protein Asp2 [Ruminococcus flavefaciens]|nr:accessory Sec system protein Asp2 [Ruminococcus flavefaciens]
MATINILQIGENDWNTIYKLPEYVTLDHADSLEEPLEKAYDMFFLDRNPADEEIGILYRAAKAYTVFFTDKVDVRGRTEWLCRSRKAERIAEGDIQRFLTEESRYYFARPYGEKLRLRDVAIAQGFRGKVKWNGNYSVELEDDFGEKLRQVAYWRFNNPMPKGEMADFWVEYKKDPTVQVVFEFTLFASGTASIILEQHELKEENLNQIIRMESKKGDGTLFVSIRAKGKGKLELVALHKRLSRGSHGYFLPGGERYVSSKGEEAFCYFEPADLKPPLCVYFSGYKTLQGFEGYYMMKGLGCPFLLISEPRLEGGGFYMGSAEYERLFVEAIRRHTEELGFTSDQVILSGLSMGTTGALYYGCDIRPHAMIVGKPLASIGNVAANEKHLRPGGFPTSLDVLKLQCGGLDEESVRRLNDKFWRKFGAADWGRSKFAVAYMLEDDYDTDAYAAMLSYLESEGVQAYGKGLHGRHNDNTSGIINWFLGQYNKILKEDFGRGKGQ